MENSFQTSFIPKKPIISSTNNTSTSSSSTSITMVVTVFIFIVMIVATGGLYFYKNYVLLKNKEDLSANLSKIRDSFDKNTIAELELYDKRTTVAKDILSNHIVLSPLFETINSLTLSSIQYTKFEHVTVDGVFSVKMSGIARDYKSIALQADVFNTDKGKMFKDVIFSNLTKNKNNYVTFDVEFNVDPSLLSYSQNIAGNGNAIIDNSSLNTGAVSNNTVSAEFTQSLVPTGIVNGPGATSTDNATTQLPVSNNTQ